MKDYKLEISPMFKRELINAVDYIAENLGNPSAADKFCLEVECAIKKRLQMPESFESVRSSIDRDNVYYRIYVGNYIVFYTVIGDTMKVMRLIYGARDIGRLI